MLTVDRLNIAMSCFFQAFLHLYAEKYSGGSAGLDYPVTPGGMELDQSTDSKNTLTLLFSRF